MIDAGFRCGSRTRFCPSITVRIALPVHRSRANSTKSVSSSAIRASRSLAVRSGSGMSKTASRFCMAGYFANRHSDIVWPGNGRRRYRSSAPVSVIRSAPASSTLETSQRSSSSTRPMQSNLLSGASESTPNMSSSLQLQAMALAAHLSIKTPAASTIRRHRSDENPAGAGIDDIAAKPSAHRFGTPAPSSTIATRSSRPSMTSAATRDEMAAINSSLCSRSS